VRGQLVLLNIFNKKQQDMKDLLFKRRVRDGEYFADHYFTAAEGTEEILPFDQEGTSQVISTDWAEHYAQQTNPLNVHSAMAFSLEEMPVDGINTKYFMGDTTLSDGVYFDEMSSPSHLSNCVEDSQEEDYGTSYFIEVVDASRPAFFYMEGVQKRVHYVPFMGWFTTFARNPSRIRGGGSRRTTPNDNRFPAAFVAWKDEEGADTILVRCVEAVHIDQEGNESCPYTWEVPQEIEIEVGDTLVVESRVGSQHVVVVACSTVYTITRPKQNTESDSLHPYCAVVHNCGKL